MKCPKCGQEIVTTPVLGNDHVVRKTCGCGSKIVDKQGRRLLQEG